MQMLTTIKQYINIEYNKIAPSNDMAISHNTMSEGHNNPTCRCQK